MLQGPRLTGKMTTGMSNNNTYNERSGSLMKDLSISEILKLAENRARVAGISERSTDNPWRKRMTVSDNVTRRQATPTIQASHQQLESKKTGEGEMDTNEEFFENLMKKMAMEQFMPRDKSDKLRKRTCLWNKENLRTSFNTIKRAKDSRINTTLIPPTMEIYAMRSLPLPNNDDSPDRRKIRSPCETVKRRQEDRVVPWHELGANLIQENINMKEPNSHFADPNLSSAITVSIDKSFHGNHAADCCISPFNRDTLKLEYNRSIEKTDGDFIDEALSYLYDAEKSSKNTWGGPHLSAIEEYGEPSTVLKSPTVDDVDMEFDITLQLTPPISSDSVNCRACNFAEKEYDDNGNDNYNQLSLPVILGDSDCEILEMSHKNLFT